MASVSAGDEPDVEGPYRRFAHAHPHRGGDAPARQGVAESGAGAQRRGHAAGHPRDRRPRGAGPDAERNLGRRPAPARHGRQRRRRAGAVADGVHLLLPSGAEAGARLCRDPERGDCRDGQAPARPFHRPRLRAAAGAGTRRRRTAPRHDEARSARRHDRHQRQRPQSRRPSARAVLGRGGRPRRLHLHPSAWRHRRRAAVLLLHEKFRLAAVRYHDRRRRPRVRRRAGAVSEVENLPGAWRRLRALPGRTFPACL